jgi:CarboxypepD_reg-like domain/Secretion system C-terminal sorting domain
MNETQQGRFCMSCQKEVIDFNAMTDKEILLYISGASSNICGRVGNDQLNRHLIIPAEPRKIWWKYWMSVAASFVMLTSKSNAQGRVSVHRIVSVPKQPVKNIPQLMGKMVAVNNMEAAIRGRIIDANGIGIAYASVILKESSKGIMADSAGYFTMKVNTDLTGAELIISSVGYQPKNIEIDKADNKKIAAGDNELVVELGDIILREPSMKEVIVTGYPSKGKVVIAGGLSVCRRTTRYEQVKARVKEVIGTNEIKVYPNPVATNSPFTIGFNVKDPGEYTVQFIDVSGRIIHGKQINILSKNYTESFNGNIFLTSGMYIVNVTGKQNSKNYTAKLVVQ